MQPFFTVPVCPSVCLSAYFELAGRKRCLPACLLASYTHTYLHLSSFILLSFLLILLLIHRQTVSYDISLPLWLLQFLPATVFPSLSICRLHNFLSSSGDDGGGVIVLKVDWKMHTQSTYVRSLFFFSERRKRRNN